MERHDSRELRYMTDPLYHALVHILSEDRQALNAALTENDHSRMASYFDRADQILALIDPLIYAGRKPTAEPASETCGKRYGNSNLVCAKERGHVGMHVGFWSDYEAVRAWDAEG